MLQAQPFLGESLGWLQRWMGPAVVGRRQFSSSKGCLSVAGGWEERMGSRRGRVPERRVCQKDLSGTEQLASAASSDWLAQEDPNYSRIAVSIMAAAGAVWAIRH